MRRALFLAILLTLCLLQSAEAQHDSVISRIIAIGQSDNRTMQYLDVLTNRIGGRLVGSNAYDNAVTWSSGLFREWGMEVEFDEAGEVPVGFNRGPWFGRMLSDDGMILHFATPSYTSGTKGVQRGHVVMEPKTQAEFDRMKGRLSGAWVLITGESKGWPVDFSEKADRRRDSIKQVNIEIEKKNNEIRRKFWSDRTIDLRRDLLPYAEEPALFYREMCEAGILGIIQAAPVPITALYDRNNIMQMSFDNLPSVPDIKLNEHQYRIIEQKVKERQEVVLEFDIRNHFRPGPVKFCNVIGIIPGTEFPDELVIMCGHLDAYDVATGGVDDGSGVTPVMEAARLIMLSGAKPKRTIMVVLWAGEEFGLLGSQSWIDRNPDKLDKISNLFNRDSGPLVPSGITVSEAMWNDMEAICAPLSDINPAFPFRLTKRNPSPKPEKAWGSDSGPFAVKGVPTMGFSLADPKGYDFDYMEIWHTERDTYNKSIPEYQEHTAIVTAITVLGVANLPHLLNRDGFFMEPEPEMTKPKSSSKQNQKKSK
jgi:hypothetical protein